MSSTTVSLDDGMSAKNMNDEKKRNVKKLDFFDVVYKDGGDDTSIDEEVLFDQPPATRLELWSYYLYYNGVRQQYTPN
jgi:hypothetical protein